MQITLAPSSGWHACQPLGLPEEGAALYVDCTLRTVALRPALQNFRDRELAQNHAHRHNSPGGQKGTHSQHLPTEKFCLRESAARLDPDLFTCNTTYIIPGWNALPSDDSHPAHVLCVLVTSFNLSLNFDRALAWFSGRVTLAIDHTLKVCLLLRLTCLPVSPCLSLSLSLSLLVCVSLWLHTHALHITMFASYLLSMSTFYLYSCIVCYIWIVRKIVHSMCVLCACLCTYSFHITYTWTYCMSADIHVIPAFWQHDTHGHPHLCINAMGPD
jgi:hypothetical protein